MTHTIVNRIPFTLGSMPGVLVEVDITTYTTGGEVITDAEIGLPTGQTPQLVSFVPEEDNLFARWDKANNQLILFDEGGEKAATDAGVSYCLFVAEVE